MKGNEGEKIELILANFKHGNYTLQYAKKKLLRILIGIFL